MTAAVGEPLGPGDWLTIDQDRIDAFGEGPGTPARGDVSDVEAPMGDVPATA